MKLIISFLLLFCCVAITGQANSLSSLSNSVEIELTANETTTTTFSVFDLELKSMFLFEAIGATNCLIDVTEYSGYNDDFDAFKCCKTCKKGKACGDTCIARNKKCHVGKGCACNG